MYMNSQTHLEQLGMLCGSDGYCVWVAGPWPNCSEAACLHVYVFGHVRAMTSNGDIVVVEPTASSIDR